jgi:hypothetical protein
MDNRGCEETPERPYSTPGLQHTAAPDAPRSAVTTDPANAEPEADETPEEPGYGHGV